MLRCLLLQRSGEGDGGSENEAGPAPHTSCEEDDGSAQCDQLAEEKEGDKDMVKPPYSYAQLIVQALLAPKDRRQTLSGIYNFIAEKYPFYKLEDKGWKVRGWCSFLLSFLCDFCRTPFATTCPSTSTS